MLLPLQGECVQSCCSRGAASLCPGLCAPCPFRARSFQGVFIHGAFIHGAFIHGAFIHGAFIH
ncbi:hypothetical protein, partial [Xylanibacter rodentium]|uniref:hypothetical protein n=1 Tax=Xylanibacter rodentium TaxID=2736289 RepID=UPI00259B2B76